MSAFIKKRSMSIKTRLVFIFVVVILLTSISISMFSYKAAENTIKTQSADWISAYINQTVNRFDFFLGSILRASMSITFNRDLNKTLPKISEGSYEDYNSMLRAMDLVSVFNNTNQYVYQVSIYAFKNNIVLTSRGRNTPINPESEEYKLIKQILIDNPRAKTVTQKWIENRSVIFEQKSIRVFTLIMPINDRYSNEIIGCVVTYILDDQISSLFKDLNISKNGNVVLIDEYGKVISALDKNMVGQDFSMFIEQDSSRNLLSYNKTVNGRDYFVTYARTQYAGWGFISIIPIKELMQKNTGVLGNTIILITGITFLLSILISYIFNLNFYKPVKYLVENIKLHDTDKNIDRSLLSRNDEISFIFRSFNEVFSEKRELIKNVYEQKLHLKEAEIRLLHSQINPHFLYNSLDNVIWMNKSQKHDEANNLVKAIVKFFRFSLSKGDEIVTVSQVKEQMESYFSIQKIRYADRLKVGMDFEKPILHCKMLKLLLQPIIENSIYHGIEKKAGEGMIEISGNREGNTLVFKVEDDGVGVSPERLTEVNRIINSDEQDEENFSALQNINKRIKLFYGDDYGIELSSHEGEGTTVIVKVPVLDDTGEGE